MKDIENLLNSKELLKYYKQLLMNNNHKVTHRLDLEDKEKIQRVFNLIQEEVYVVIYKNENKEENKIEEE